MVEISDAHYTILDKKTTDYISLGLIDRDYEEEQLIMIVIIMMETITFSHKK